MATAKLVEQSGLLYERLDSEATDETVTTDETIQVRIWRGKLVETCLDLRIPYGSYRGVVQALESLGCIQMLAAGTRGSPTLIVLLTPPTEELWAGYDSAQEKRDRPLTSSQKSATLEARVSELERKLGGADLSKVLVNFEQRLTTLEAQSGEGEVVGKTKSKSK